MLYACRRQLSVNALFDRHVKVYDSSTYQVVHTINFPAPVLSIGCSVCIILLLMSMFIIYDYEQQFVRCFLLVALHVRTELLQLVPTINFYCAGRQ